MENYSDTQEIIAQIINTLKEHSTSEPQTQNIIRFDID